jgi:3-oxoacyl-[acyl-carrier protein] reductase
VTTTVHRSLGSYPDLLGKTVVVTGGSRGIGAATAAALGANGAAVVVVGRDRAAIDHVVETITSRGGQALGAVADCTAEADLITLVDHVHDRLGPIDMLAAFAGGYGAPVATIVETEQHWRLVLDGNLTATFLTIKAFLPDLTARGGTIVTMASESARQATQSSAVYAAAKGGVVALSRHLAKELAADGVRVNCLAPATIENESMRARMPEDRRQQLIATFPLGRLGQPDDVAAATLFLASQASGWITGTTIDIAGGRTML